MFQARRIYQIKKTPARTCDHTAITITIYGNRHHFMFRAYDGPVNLGNQTWRDEHCLELDISESWIKPKSTTGQNNAGVHSCTAQPTLNPAILSANARRRLVPLMQSCKTLQNVLDMQPKILNREFLVNQKREYAPCAIYISRKVACDS